MCAICALKAVKHSSAIKTISRLINISSNCLLAIHLHNTLCFYTGINELALDGSFGSGSVEVDCKDNNH